MKKISIYLLAGMAILSSCKKDYFDLSNNPNVSSKATPDLVLTNALKVTGGTQITPGAYTAVSEWMGYWAPSGSYAISSSDGASYKQTNDFGDPIWTTFYRNLEDYEYVEKTATENKQYFYTAAAKTMKALVFGQLVDGFNNIPYKQALQGTSLIQPQYDNGKDVYEALAADLDAAISLFKRTDAVGSPTQDILFAGNNAKWIQFANTLKLRLLIRQSEMSGRSAYIQTEINKIIANGGGFLIADAGVNPGYSNSTGKQNPLYGFNYNTAGTFIQDFWRANKFPITFGIANNDVRYKFLYAPINNGTWVGNVIGSTSNAVGSLSSTLGSGVLKSVSQPAIILSAAESYFLQAEAGLRGWIANSPQTMFDKGVQASFTFLGAGSSATYTSQSGNKQTNFAACATNAEKLNCIIRQKWMANNTVTPFEGWCDFRRTGLPADLPISIHPQADVYAIPFRFLYPTSEYQTNTANVNAQGSINHHTSKIFWMP
jgi:Starch-binding associating with outer membrane